MSRCGKSACEAPGFEALPSATVQVGGSDLAPGLAPWAGAGRRGCRNRQAALLPL